MGRHRDQRGHRNITSYNFQIMTPGGIYIPAISNIQKYTTNPRIHKLIKNTLPWPPWSSAAPTLSFSESPLTLFVATNVPPRLSHDVSFQTSRNFSITACRTWVTIGTFGASNFNFWPDLWVSDGWYFTNLEISKCESENHWLRVLK